MITYLRWKFFRVRYSLGPITYLWGILAELSDAIIVAYWRKEDNAGHYVAGIRCGGGEGGLFKFYNADWEAKKRSMSIWGYLNEMKRNNSIPLCLIGVSLKKGKW